MPKPNTMVLLMQARQEIKRQQAELNLVKGFTVQQCEDIARIALNREFHFGPAYNERFSKVFREMFLAFTDMCIDDSSDDETAAYTKGKLDRMLRAACGDDIPDFDARYNADNIYLRGRGFGGAADKEAQDG